MTWDEKFLHMFDHYVTRYRGGDAQWEKWYTKDELSFLDSIGCQKREFFDFVEDRVDSDSWEASTVLLIAAVRRDYFLTHQKGKPSQQPKVTPQDLPTFGDSLDGYYYLPRILAKARGKLTGTLDPDIMYGCGGDRKFLTENNIHPADFLRHVWAAGDDDQKIINWLKNRSME